MNKKSKKANAVNVPEENLTERVEQTVVEKEQTGELVNADTSLVQQEEVIVHDNSGITEESSVDSDTVPVPVESSDVVVTGEPVTESNDINIKERRKSGSGSVYPLTVGSGFGFCIQLTSDKALRKQYGNKLRYLGTGKTYEETDEKCRLAIEKKEELLKAKLIKLGHVVKNEVK